MEFPDEELGLKEILDETETRVVLYLPADVYENMPIIQIAALPSTAQAVPFLKTARVQIDVYAEGRDAAKDLALQCRALVAGPQETSQGLLDAVYPEIEPYEVPFQHDTVNLFTAVYRVDTRPKR